MMGKKCVGSKIIWALLFAGGLNWGLVGAFKFNLVNAIFGGWAWLEMLIYILVGLAAVASLFHCKCKVCKGEMSAAK